MSVIEKLLKRLPENNRLERIWKLAQIDFMKRYYNDRLGLVWALINPLFQIIVYYIVFTGIMESTEENYALFLSCGILFWGFFAEVSKGGMTIIVSKIYLIESIQFNKIDLFISHTLSVLMGFVFNLIVYISLALMFGIEYNATLLFVLPVLFNVALLAIALSMILSIMVLFVEDIRHLWDMFLFIGFWGSGVIVSMDRFIEKIPIIVYLNPLIPLLDNVRNALLYGIGPNFGLLSYSLLFSIIFFVFALWLFRRSEHLILEKL